MSTKADGAVAAVIETFRIEDNPWTITELYNANVDVGSRSTFAGAVDKLVADGILIIGKTTQPVEYWRNDKHPVFGGTTYIETIRSRIDALEGAEQIQAAVEPVTDAKPVYSVKDALDCLNGIDVKRAKATAPAPVVEPVEPVVEPEVEPVIEPVKPVVILVTDDIAKVRARALDLTNGVFNHFAERLSRVAALEEENARLKALPPKEEMMGYLTQIEGLKRQLSEKATAYRRIEDERDALKARLNKLETNFMAMIREGAVA